MVISSGHFRTTKRSKSIYNNNPSILARLDGIYIDDALIQSNIRDYKMVDGVIVKKSDSDIPDTLPGPTQQEIIGLKEENQTLGQQVVDLDLRLLMGGM